MTTDNVTADAGAGDAAAATGGEIKEPEGIRLTSAQLNARLERAKQSATAELLTGLGVKDAAELEATVKAHREAEAAQQSEAERERARAEAAAAAASSAQQELRTERLGRAVEQAALRAGVPGDRVAMVARLVDPAAIVYGADGAITGADEAITALLTDNAWITGGATKAAVGTSAGGGARGAGGAAGALSEEQQWGARVTGVNPERYARAATAKPGDPSYVADSLEALAASMRGGNRS